MLIIPKPQKMEILNDYLQVPINYITINEFSLLFKNELELILKHPLQTTNGENPEGTIYLEKAPLEEEAYQLKITKEAIYISASNNKGIYYGIKTLKQIVRQSNLPCLEIDDYPSIKTRGILLDISRNKVPTIETIKKLIDLFSDIKINHLELYIEGFSFEYKKYLDIIPHTNHISQSDYMELDSYANDHYIDLVPNQNGFGHMGDWLSLDKFKDLAECPEGFDIWGSHRTSTTLNPLDEGSTELVKSLYDELLPISMSSYFNMNFDEPYELGHGKSKLVCEKTSKEDVFINYFIPLANYVKSYQKTPLLWGDFLMHHPEAINKLPKDVIFIDWGYSKNYDFMSHAKTLEEIGIKYYLAPGTSTWSSITGRYIDMISSIKNSSEASKLHHANGLLITDWGDMGHLQYLPFSYAGFIYGAMASWSQASEEDMGKYLTHVVGDNNLSKALLELATYHNLEGEYRDYGSRLFSSIMWAELITKEGGSLDEYLVKMKSNLIEQKNLESLTNLFNNVKQNLQATDSMDIVHLEIDNSILLLETLLKTNLLWNDVINNPSNNHQEQINDIIDNLSLYTSTHQNLWIARNLSEGYHFSIEKIKQLIDMLMLQKEREEKA